MSSRARLRLLLIALVLVLCDQLVQHALLRHGAFFSRRVAPFDPPLFCADQEQSLANVRRALARSETTAAFDGELGWCPHADTIDGEDRFDWAGCRIGVAPLSRAKSAAQRRVVTIGESFTFGAEVPAADSWVARVDRAREDLEIANLAVGGYGLDQALLRLRRDGFALAPDEVWLGLVPGTAIRVTTLYLPALRHWFSSVGFKPRFVLDARDELVLVPNPAPTPQALSELLGSQRKFLDAVSGRDVWIDRAPAAYSEDGAQLWQHSGLARLWVTWNERTQREPAPWFEEPTSELSRLVRAIVLRTRTECEEHHARFRLVLLPESGDLKFLRENGHAYWAPLLAELRAQGIEVLDATDALVAAGGDEEPTLWAPQGHYSPRGNLVVAENVVGLGVD